MKTEEIIDYLFRISQGKHRLAKDLLLLTKQQGESLKEEEVNNLQESLNKKQNVMDKIDILDREFLEKFGLLKKELNIEDFKDLEDKEFPGLRGLQQEIQEIVAVMKEIQNIDDENTLRMKEAINQAKGKLKSIKTGKKAVAGYTNQAKRSPSIYLDKKK